MADRSVAIFFFEFFSSIFWLFSLFFFFYIWFQIRKFISRLDFYNTQPFLFKQTNGPSKKISDDEFMQTKRKKKKSLVNLGFGNTNSSNRRNFLSEDFTVVVKLLKMYTLFFIFFFFFSFCFWSLLQKCLFRNHINILSNSKRTFLTQK